MWSALVGVYHSANSNLVILSAISLVISCYWGPELLFNFLKRTKWHLPAMLVRVQSVLIKISYATDKRNISFPLYIHRMNWNQTTFLLVYQWESSLLFGRHYSFCIPAQKKSVEIICPKSDRSPGSICWSGFAIPCGYKHGGQIMAQGNVACTSRVSAEQFRHPLAYGLRSGVSCKVTFY